MAITSALDTQSPPKSSQHATARWSAQVFRFCVLGYCGWQAADLGIAWRSNSPEAWGWLMFAVWLVPAIFAGVSGAGRNQPQLRLLAVAVSLSLVGQVLWLNVLQYVALAVAIAGWQQPLRNGRLWLAASFLWMPACGWLVAGVAGGWETGLRVAGVVTVSAVTVAHLGSFRIPSGPAPWAFASVAWVLLAAAGSAKAETYTYSPVQSPARPLGLELANFVGTAGSDAASANFLTNTLPTMQALINQNLKETVSIAKTAQTGGLIALDPNALKLSVAADVRVYFVGEGASYRNSLGYNTEGGGASTGDPLLIFPNASSPNSYYSSGTSTRTTSEPLFPGDFVDLGHLDVGEQLDFFLIASGATGGSTVYSTDTSINPDRINHVVAFAQVASPYVLIGFEDMLGGGDNDYNDLLFAVYFGEQNVSTLVHTAALHGVPAPEPGLMWAMVLGGGGWLYRARRKRARS